MTDEFGEPRFLTEESGDSTRVIGEVNAMVDRFSVSETEDEYGTPRFFAEERETGEWPGGAHDTYEQAAEECRQRNEKEDS